MISFFNLHELFPALVVLTTLKIQLIVCLVSRFLILFLFFISSLSTSSSDMGDITLFFAVLSASFCIFFSEALILLFQQQFLPAMIYFFLDTFLLHHVIFCTIYHIYNIFSSVILMQSLRQVGSSVLFRCTSLLNTPFLLFCFFFSSNQVSKFMIIDDKAGSVYHILL